VDGPFDFSENDYYPDSPAAFNWQGSQFNFAGWQTFPDKMAFYLGTRVQASVPGQPFDFVLRPGSTALGKARI